MLDGKNLWDTFLFLFFDVADMWTATIALALMIIVVITSINMARKKLSLVHRSPNVVRRRHACDSPPVFNR